MRHIKKWLLALILATGAASVAEAQPPFPQPIPVPNRSPIDGVWFFRGDPRKPCYVQTVRGPRGPLLIFTNEQGTEASGWISPSGRQVTIPDWNLTGTIRGDRLVWPNGDFWGR